MRIIGTHLSKFELDMICDMLMMKDSTQSGQVTKHQLKQFLIEDIKVNLLDRDVEVLIKTLPAFADKNLLTRPDIMLAFEKCYNDAKETSFFEQASKSMPTNYRQESLGAFSSKGPSKKPIVNPFEASEVSQTKQT